MDRIEWLDICDRLARQAQTIQGWPATIPDPMALRCEQCRHRTLAHLRACQEQWLEVARCFIDRESPSVNILHPWRKFEVGEYPQVPWIVHLEKFAADRILWLEFRDTVDWERSGKWNRKLDTIGGLSRRLADHEAHHLQFFA